MAAKGTIAKENVVSRIATAFGSDFIGEVDKKVYVWSEENGEKVQVAISLTCPKTPVGVKSATKDGGIDFENMGTVIAPSAFTPAEISDEEKQNIANLIEKLGL